jgi:hypothetical protein
MAGHKDLYQTVQNSLTGLTGSNSSTTDATGQQISTNTHASAQDCLDRNKETGRINKYRASPNKNKNKNKDAAATTNNNGSDNSTTSTTVTATATKAASKKATETKKATAASSSSNNINTTDNSNNSKGNGKRDRSSSVASDRSSSSNSTATAQEALGEGMSFSPFAVLVVQFGRHIRWIESGDREEWSGDDDNSHQAQRKESWP